MGIVMGKKQHVKTMVELHSEHFCWDNLIGDIDSVIGYLTSIRDNIKSAHTNCDRIWIDKDWYDEGNAGYYVYAERSETDDEYEFRMHRTKEAKKETQRLKEKLELQEFEKLEKRYQRLAKKIQKMKSKDGS